MHHWLHGFVILFYIKKPPVKQSFLLRRIFQPAHPKPYYYPYIPVFVFTHWIIAIKKQDRFL